MIFYCSSYNFPNNPLTDFFFHLSDVITHNKKRVTEKKNEWCHQHIALPFPLRQRWPQLMAKQTISSPSSSLGPLQQQQQQQQEQLYL